MIRFKCPGCGTKLSAKDELAGRKLKCPKCSESLLVPKPKEQLATKPAAASTATPTQQKTQIPFDGRDDAPEDRTPLPADADAITSQYKPKLIEAFAALNDASELKRAGDGERARKGFQLAETLIQEILQVPSLPPSLEAEAHGLHGLCRWWAGAGGNLESWQREARSALERSLTLGKSSGFVVESESIYADALADVYDFALGAGLSSLPLVDAQTILRSLENLVSQYKAVDPFNEIQHEGFVLFGRAAIAFREKRFDDAAESFERFLTSPYKEHFSSDSRGGGVLASLFTDACKNLGGLYLSNALRQIKEKESYSEAVIGLLSKAIELGVPSERKLVLAHLYLALACADKWGRTGSTDERLLAQYADHLETASKLDSQGKHGILERHLYALPMYDDRCSFQGSDIAESDGSDAAIAYLESKLTLFEHIPGDPLIHILNNLAELYWNCDEEHACWRESEAYGQRVLNSRAPSGWETKYQDVKNHAKSNLDGTMVFRVLTRAEEKGRRYAKGKHAVKEQSIYRQAEVAARKRPATRTVLIGKLIVNSLFVIPYIVLFAQRAQPTPPLWAVVSVLVWGFVGFVWLLKAFMSRRQLKSMSKLTLSCAVLLGGLLCAVFGFLIIPAVICLDIVRLVRLSRKR